MRDHLVGVDRMLKLGGITGDRQQPERNWDDIVGKSGHRLQIFEAEVSILPKAGVEKPGSQLRQLIELDRVAIVKADIAEARKLAHQSLHQTVAVVVKLRRTRGNEIMKTTVVRPREHAADMVQ